MLGLVLGLGLGLGLGEMWPSVVLMCCMHPSPCSCSCSGSKSARGPRESPKIVPLKGGKGIVHNSSQVILSSSFLVCCFLSFIIYILSQFFFSARAVAYKDAFCPQLQQKTNASGLDHCAPIGKGIRLVNPGNGVLHIVSF